MSSSVTPRYLDFNRNESFAASLRSERERRAQSWNNVSQGGPDEELPIVYHTRGVTQSDIAIHKELHHIAKIFYTGTNLVAIRNASRKKSLSDGDGVSESESSAATESSPVSLITIETASSRRRIEIPDDDSSFLLRAQPRQLNAVGVHRDARNHDQSFKCFAATYEEPVLNSRSERYSGGRYVRSCLLRYYPIDRTASIALQTTEARKLDQRKGKGSVPDTITVGQSGRPTPFLSNEFLRERHLCQRWIPKGTSRPQSILSSSVMEPTDFSSTPRSGKAIDFVYRTSFFERPMVDLGGKHFTVSDSASLGTHRADSSSIEMSDATLSIALLTLSFREAGEDLSSGTTGAVEMGEDGYPVVWMKFSRKENDSQIEVKPYRLSFVRAALMVTAARHEAQYQNLISCVRSGSAKKATKALTDKRLKPTVRLLEYAGNRSREKQYVLLRDLKLGVNHIDREQLRRNGLLSPRFPTVLREVTATVEDAVSAAEVRDVDLHGESGIVFKIKCVAVVDIEDSEIDNADACPYKTNNGSIARRMREEWVLYRSLNEFQALHKHLKVQVSASESSGSAGSRLVGAATAAFNATGSGAMGRSRQRQALIPSLAQVSKLGALGSSKKSILKKKELLDGYLKFLLSHGHLLSRSAELMLFLGAFFPLAEEVRPGRTVSGVPDPLGRTQMCRIVLETSETPASNPITRAESEGKDFRSSQGSMSGLQGDEQIEESENGDQKRKSKKVKMIPAIENKIDKVPLPLVRNRMFDLLRYLFGFENASFARNRLLAALKTASFAVTSASEFKRSLYRVHTSQISAEAIAGWIEFGIDMLWPNGIFYESSPPISAAELEAASHKAKEILHSNFPEQLRAVLGPELTRDGLDLFHEMLQNRIVVKSLGYMLFDLLCVEVFPEIGDVLEGGAALDVVDP